jgi:hypothetical protein
VQVDPIKVELEPPGTQGLKLECDILLSMVAFKFNLRLCNLEVLSQRKQSTIETAEAWRVTAEATIAGLEVRRCKLNTIKTRVQSAPGFSA